MLPRLPRSVKVSLTIILAVLSAGAGAYFSAPWPKPGTGEEAVLARVGDRAITVSDFLREYEFGFPHLKQGVDPVSRKRTCLHAMVNELLITHEGFRLGLDRSQRVVDQDTWITTDLLTEALIRAEVVEKTHVSDAEVRNAITASHVHFRFRYWGEPSLAQAEAVRQQMVRAGYASVVDSLRRAHPDTRLDPAMLESGDMNAFEIDPPVLAAIRDLEVGGISAPVAVNGGYYVFQVTAIRRSAILEHEYTTRFETMKKVLLNAKYDERIGAFVGGFMTPRHVVTKAGTFEALCNAVVEWKVTGDHKVMMLRDAVFSSAHGRPSYAALAARAGQPIVTYVDGWFTVAGFLDVFLPSVRDIDPADMPQVRHLLSEQVALCVRDQLLAAEARRRQLDASPAFMHERELWMRKAVYDEARMRFVSPAPGRDGVLTAHAMLTRAADSLRALVPVTINTAMLDTLRVHETPSSRMVGMQVFKLGSKRPAFPVTDGIWGIRATSM